MTGQRVLVTGASGYVGRWVLEHWRREHPDAQVWATGSDGVDLTPLAHRSMTVDLCDAQATNRLIREAMPTHIVHLAGRIAPGTLSAHLQVNAVATGNLYQALVEQGLANSVRIVQAGTAAAYGPVSAADLPVAETHPLRPVTAYALSKCTQEQIAGLYAAQHGLQVIRARIFNLVGPGQGAHLVPATFIRQLAAAAPGGAIEVGNLVTRRDFVDVRDVASALDLLLARGAPGEACNVGSGASTAIGDVLQMLVELSGRRDVVVRSQAALMRGIDVPDIFADVRRIRDMVGWRARITLRDTLADMLRAVGVEPCEGLS